MDLIAFLSGYVKYVTRIEGDHPEVAGHCKAVMTNYIDSLTPLEAERFPRHCLPDDWFNFFW